MQISIAITLLPLATGCSVGTAEPSTTSAAVTTTEKDAWFVSGSRGEDYDVSVASDPADPGGRIRHLRSKPGVAGNGFGTMMQTFAADRYRGKRVRFSASVQSTDVTGWSGLWMRIDGPDRHKLGFDNMQSRPIVGTTPATRYEVVLDVPVAAHGIALGVLLRGPGEVVLASASVETVGMDVPVTSSAPTPAPSDGFQP